MFIQPKERSSVMLFLSSRFIGETSGYEQIYFHLRNKNNMTFQVKVQGLK